MQFSFCFHYISSQTLCLPIWIEKCCFHLNPQEPDMEIHVALSVAPLNAPHKDLDYFPLVDKDFQIKGLITDKNHLKVFCQSRDNYLNGSDIIGLWESNLPMYFLPSIHILP